MKAKTQKQYKNQPKVGSFTPEPGADSNFLADLFEPTKTRKEILAMAKAQVKTTTTRKK